MFDCPARMKTLSGFVSAAAEALNVRVRSKSRMSVLMVAGGWSGGLFIKREVSGFGSVQGRV
jgi:hypothetical protein